MTLSRIPFNRLSLTGRELDYIAEAIASGELGGDGPFARRCERWLEENVGCRRALLTHSGTGALEMAAILADVGPGDEVILPSFTFASTANAFVLRGAVPVFVDIVPDTLTLDPNAVAAAVTSRTRAIVPVHYAGIGCDMDTLVDIANGARAIVIEDAAQALLSTHAGRPLGSIGSLGALSFHQTKNVSSGEAGALLVNDERLIRRAEIVREKGTNRSAFHRGDVDKYTWTDVGSSFLPNELTAAFLFAQLEAAEEITARRQRVWDLYHASLEQLERDGLLLRPRARANAHIYYVILPSLEERTYVINALRAQSISAVFHYVPLHSSPAGRRYGRAAGSLAGTDEIADRLLRLPLWPDMTAAEIDAVVSTLTSAVKTGMRT